MADHCELQQQQISRHSTALLLLQSHLPSCPYHLRDNTHPLHIQQRMQQELGSFGRQLLL
jgi:hypothetical protein